MTNSDDFLCGWAYSPVQSIKCSLVNDGIVTIPYFLLFPVVMVFETNMEFTEEHFVVVAWIELYIKMCWLVFNSI